MKPEKTMWIRTLILAAAAATPLALGAEGQQKQQLPTDGGVKAAGSLPKECRTAAQAGGQSPTMQDMDMQGPMQMGIMANDPDVAFICGMIPHHQGAVDMAEVVLKTGHNPEARRFAEQVIREQGREINWMEDWLKKYAKKEGN